MKLFRPPRLIDRIFRSFTLRFDVSEPVIFLTFDDGPDPEITPFVLDQLQIFGQKATFFCVGENVRRYPELVQRILSEGHRIGNHTMRHENGMKTDTVAYLQSFADFNTLYPTPIFRPPYGRIRLSQSRNIRRKARVIMWSFLTYDFDHTVPVGKILEESKSIRPGDIIVLHDNRKITDRQKQLLPALLRQLESRNLRSAVIPD